MTEQQDPGLRQGLTQPAEIAHAGSESEHPTETQIRRAVSDFEHPSWCDRERCTAGDPRVGMHASARITEVLDEGGVRTVSLHLTQALAHPGWPNPATLVVLEFCDTGHDPVEDEEIQHFESLRVGSAGALGQLLCWAAQTASR